MAINIKKYVDISTTFPSADVAGRSFGGLVFTATEMLPDKGQLPEYKEAYETYNDGGVCFLTLSEVGALFGAGLWNSETQKWDVEPSEEYLFATGYYGYVSPSGRFASRMCFSKVLNGERPIDAFKRVNATTNLFGSFTFLSLSGGGESSVIAEDVDISLLVEVAEYNQTLDTKYLFVVNRVRGELPASNVTQECRLFKDISGTCYVSGKTAVSAYMPMAILASTDYSAGQVVNFMFKQFSTEEPTVFDDDTYKKFNLNLVNFFGRTQTNGQTVDFYQRGFNTNGTDTAIYCNELWFKSICETALIDLEVSRERISADPLGVDLVKLEVVDCCSNAIRNGMFMQKELVASDLRSIREIIINSGGSETDVGSIEADVSTKGYSVYAFLKTIADEALSGVKEKSIVYYVFYGTADSVRYIKGNDILLK